MPEEKNEVKRSDVSLSESGNGDALAQSTETSNRITPIRSLLPSAPSAYDFFLSLWVAKREEKARQAAAAVARADRELTDELILREQALKRADDLDKILEEDHYNREARAERARLLAAQAKAQREDCEAQRAAKREGAPAEARPKRTRADALKNRLFEESRLTTELQQAAGEEIVRITKQIERNEIDKDTGNRLIQNIRDTLEKLLEEL
jgi:hypothetical protein